AAAYSDLDCYADTTERDDSTSRTGHHTARVGDSLTRTGDGITGTCYCITGTAMIDQGVTAALAARDANKNGDDSHTLGTGGRSALTWWNSYVMTVSHDAAYAMTWADLR
ncbi:hypothetical protein Tco_0022683, partial [Tanacetum coccineum]